MKTSTLIKFPVTSFRRLEGPYDNEGKRNYVAIINIKNLPDEFDRWRGLNPRDPNLSSGVSKKIGETLKDDPSAFLFRNRGITLMVEKVIFNNQKQMVELEMSDKTRNGLLDGGHTFRVVKDFIENLPEEELSDFDAFVKVEIIEGIKEIDEAVAIVESRNTSIQVKEQSLEELRKHYEEIKNVLKGRAYSERIAYKEYQLQEDGSKKDIDIKEILSYLICFDIESFNNKVHPIKAYSSRAAVVDHFKNHRKRILKYIPLIPKILELKDTIHLEIPESYNKEGGKFGRLTGVIEVSDKPRMKKVQLPYTGKESRYRIPSGFIYPVLASLRNLVECDTKTCKWKTDPIKFFQELKGELAVRVGEQARELRNPNKLGKDPATWGRCYDLIELEVLKRKL